ncbi:MAG: 50S ribosomal protein L28 [Holosporales bacterium]|jgi:large subunit ribosomal protein L28|nr:50S ribosomal protein L28 [Holosporales bacterium]
MSRRCELTGKAVLYGNNVSHANNKTSRRFLPNLQRVSFLSDALAHSVRFRVSASAIRKVEARGGLDQYLLNVRDESLSKHALLVKRALRNKSVKVGEGE